MYIVLSSSIRHDNNLYNMVSGVKHSLKKTDWNIKAGSLYTVSA